jgi:hypothetical protein
MKHLLLAILTLLAFQTVNAQYRDEADGKNFFISAGPEIGAPSNTPYNLTLGAAAQAEVKLTNRLGLTLTGEITRYNYKGVFLGSVNQPHPWFIPLKAGLKYYTGPGFYFSGELGSTVHSSTDRDNVIGNMFVYSLGFGFEVPLDKHNDIDIGFAYQNYSKSLYQTTGLKVAYRFGW